MMESDSARSRKGTHMTQTVYTNYWIDKKNDIRKEHASFKTEEEAVNAIERWWEIKGENYEDVKQYRTNTGALEIDYGFEHYFYRIEEREIDGQLPSTSYQLKKPQEIEAKRSQLMLDEDYYLFDELPEPYRDRLIETMADAQKVREWSYTDKGVPILKIKDI